MNTKIREGDEVKIIGKSVLGFIENVDWIKERYPEDTYRIGEIYGDPYKYNNDDNCFEINSNYFAVKDLLLVKDGKVIGEIPKEKPYTHLVTWRIRGCDDPTEFFNTLAEARKKANTLAADRNIEVKSIRIVEIKNMWLINPSISLAKTTN